MESMRKIRLAGLALLMLGAMGCSTLSAAGLQAPQDRCLASVSINQIYDAGYCAGAVSP